MRKNPERADEVVFTVPHGSPRECPHELHGLEMIRLDLQGPGSGFERLLLLAETGVDGGACVGDAGV